MKMKLNNYKCGIGLITLFLTSFCLNGCYSMRSSPFEVFYSHSNPVEGWKNASQLPSPAIEKDYHDFINKLSLTWRDSIGQRRYLEDGNGKHAVTIEVGKNGTDWTYVLIYDRDDIRIKVLKYISGHYMS